MATNAGVAAQMARSAIGALGSSAIRGTEWVQSGAPSQAAAIARVLAKSYGHVEGFSTQQATAIARAVIKGQREAERLAADPTRAIAAGDLPVDRQLFPGEERFRYAVAVTRTAPDGSIQRDYSEVRSDIPLSADQINTLVNMSDPTPTSPPPPPRPGQPALKEWQITGVQILSAGRRGP